MNYKVLFLTCFICIVHFAYSQDSYILPKVFENSPNSASLGKFGNYPVNTFTGVPDISLPLYEIKIGDIVVPITLRYHASGIRVTDAASWVGLGWALDAGGAVSRKVMGIPDERNGSGGYGYLQGYLKPTNYSFNTGNLTDLDYLNEVRKKNYDTEPDIYTYTFPGKNGNFFFNGQNNFIIVQIPYSPVKIAKNYSGSSLSFDITDELGNYYQFGQNGAIEMSTNSFETSSSVSSWMLNKIISQSGRDTISFSYFQESYQLPGYTIDNYSFVDMVENYECSPYSEDRGTWTWSAFSSYMTDQKQDEIKFKGGKVKFVRSSSNRQDFAAKKLDAIEIYNYNYSTSSYNLIKKIQFYTTYFQSTRLKLDSVVFQDKNGVSVDRYRFSYNTTVNLPGVASKSQDYWGFFNGHNNSSLIPPTVVVFDDGKGNTTNIPIGTGNSRDSDSLYMQANILTRVYFPTGGYTDFEYQTNRYKDSQNQIKLAGGLRIKTIKSYDGLNAQPLLTTYQYGDGRANFLFNDYFFYTLQTHRYVDNSCSNPPTYGLLGTKRVRIYSSYPNIDMVAFDGSIVVYPKVTEYVGNATTNTGKTEYRYQDHVDGLNSTLGVLTKPEIESYADQRGKLREKVVYRNITGTYLPVQREVYTYNTTSFAESGNPFVGFRCDKRTINDHNNGTDGYLGLGIISDSYSFSYAFYRIRTDDNYLTSKTEKIYDQSDTTKVFISTTNYNFGNITHQQVTSSVTTNSKGDTKTVYNKYPADFGATSGFIKAMTDRNMHAFPIEQYTTIGSNIVAGQIKTYRTGSLSALIPDYVKVLEIASPTSSFTPSSVSAGTLNCDPNYKSYLSFDAYDAINNLTKYTPRTSNSVSIIWSYRNSYPVAQINNASNSNFAYSGFENSTDKGGWTYSGNPSTSTVAKSGKASYSLANGNISKTITTTGDYKVQYWAKAAVTVSGGTVTDVSSSTADANGWIFYEKKISISTANTPVILSGSTNVDEVRLIPSGSQMTSYTYEPNVGMSSQMDANGLSSYYEYDNYYRLKLVRDDDGNILKTIDYKYK